MDTISIKLYGNIEELEKIVKYKNRSNKFRVGKNNILIDGSITIIISYPKFHSTSNAYLITSKKECFISQKKFLSQLIYMIGIDINLLTYKITRVDIPFTFEMQNNEEFNHYLNTFKYIALISKDMGIDTIKSYSDFIPEEIETINFKKTNSDWSLTIYNQSKKFIDKFHSKFQKNLHKQFPDLPNRIRIEAKRYIKRAPTFSLASFEHREVFKEFFKGHQKYILKFFNKKILDDILKKEEEQLIQILKERHTNQNLPFSWQSFIQRNAYKVIKSERPLKEAIKHIALAPSTQREVIYKINSILFNLENYCNIQIKYTLDRFKNIQHCIKDYELKLNL